MCQTSLPGMRFLPRLLFAACAASLAAACALGSSLELTDEGPGGEGTSAAYDASPAQSDGAATAPGSGETADGASPSSCAKASPGDACGLLAQCGCAADETCDLVASRATCVKSGAKAAAASCTTTSDCARGLTCRGGACRPFCDGATSCSAPGLGACASPVEATSTLQACAVTCELQAPGKNCGTATCALDGTTTDCRPAGTKAIGSFCTGATECAAGATCAPTIYGKMCLRWCRIGAGECPSFGICTSPFTSTIKLGNVEYGVCPN